MRQPRSHASVVVTWASTHDCVGIASSPMRRVEQAQDRRARPDVVGGRVDADDGVAAPERQAVEHAGEHTAQVVGRVVGLQARAQATRAARWCCGRPR